MYNDHFTSDVCVCMCVNISTVGYTVIIIITHLFSTDVCACQ